MAGASLPLTKAELRERLRLDLEKIDAAAAAHASRAIAARILELPEIAGAERILTCLSFGVEVDTWHLVDRLVALGKRLYVPRADPRDRELHVHPYPCPLRTLAFGLQQPPRGTPEVAAEAIDETLDAVLVLGLGFDRRGYRLGYGSGYFDRFLAGRPFPAIGLAFAELELEAGDDPLAEQLVDELPVEPHDIAMAVVVTDTEVCRGSASPAE